FDRNSGRSVPPRCARPRAGRWHTGLGTTVPPVENAAEVRRGPPPMPRVVVAPDSMGGLLSAVEVADAIAAGWRARRPEAELATVPMSDGGEGLLAVLHRPVDRRVEAEVAGPLGHPVDAWLSLRPDGTAIVESALACGLAALG